MIHDHFDGSAHCVECEGQCRLTGDARTATELARWPCERLVMNQWTTIPELEATTLRVAGIDTRAFMNRAIQSMKGTP